MANWKVRKFRELDEIRFFLNGYIRGSDISYFASDIKSGTGVMRAPVLAGLTLIFSTPAHTFTFVAGADPGGRLTPAEIKSQIEAGSLVDVRTFEGCIAFVEHTPSTGIVLSHTGTANTLLGFDSAIDTAGIVYGIPPTAPYFDGAYSTNDNMHVLYTYE